MIELGYETYIGLNPATDPEDREDLERIIRRRKEKMDGLPTALINHLRKTEVFRVFVLPAIRRMMPSVPYTSAQIADLLGDGWTAKKVASKICVMGRPEAKYRARVFGRPSDGLYTISSAMKAAIVQN
jgi:hypothetical protein